jgi:transcriptional regulator with XRE-family HTH domain
MKADPRPELQPFAARLRQGMNGRSNSALAREVWGTIKDSRGYDVAKNRDRVAAYLKGSAYPEPENLAKIADVLGIPIEELQIKEGKQPKEPKQPTRLKTEHDSGHSGLTLSIGDWVIVIHHFGK